MDSWDNMMNDPSLLGTISLVVLGLFGMIAAVATRFVDTDLWRFTYLFCFVALGVAASLCPTWCGGQFCSCAAMLVAMILATICDFGRSSGQLERFPVS